MSDVQVLALKVNVARGDEDTLVTVDNLASGNGLTVLFRGHNNIDPREELPLEYRLIMESAFLEMTSSATKNSLEPKDDDLEVMFDTRMAWLLFMYFEKGLSIESYCERMVSLFSDMELAYPGDPTLADFLAALPRVLLDTSIPEQDRMQALQAELRDVLDKKG